MNSETIRRSRPEDVPLLSALFREAFGHERSEAIWQWKYFGERDSVGYVCEADGRIVAHCGGLPVRFRDGGRELRAFQSVDFMSSAAHAGGLAGGGVFVRTVRRMFEEHCGPSKAQLVYGFPGERHRLVGERLLGYRPLEPVQEIRIESRAASESLQPLSEEAFPLFTRLHPFLGTVRDEEYLRWRYLNHPSHRYLVLPVSGSWPFRRRFAALVRDLDEYILMMEIGSIGSQKDAMRLLGSLEKLGKPVKAWLPPQSSLALFLANAGVKATQRDHWFEYRFFIERSAPMPGEFYYTAGDYDVF